MPIIGVVASSVAKASYFLSYVADTAALASQSTATTNNEMRLDSTGNIYNGYTISVSGSQAGLTKINADGTISWQRLISETINNFALARSTAVDSSGNVYISGQFANSSGSQNVYLAKYNSSGTLQWFRALADANTAAQQNTRQPSLAIDTSGNIHISGAYRNTSGGTEGYVVKYNSSGTIQWQRTIYDPATAASRSTQLYAIAVDSSSNVYVAGSVRNTSSEDLGLIMKLDSTGATTWKSNYSAGTGNTAVAYSIAVDSSGNVFAGGYYYTVSSRAWLTKINSSGTTQWTTTWQDAQGNSSNTRCYGMGIDSSGNSYTTGQYWTGTATRCFLMKFNNSGSATFTRTMADGRSAGTTQGWSLVGDLAGTITWSGTFNNNSGGLNTFNVKVKNDGTQTGTYTFDANRSLTYGSAVTMTMNPNSLTVGTTFGTNDPGVLVGSTPSNLSDAAGTLTTGKVAAV